MRQHRGALGAYGSVAAVVLVLTACSADPATDEIAATPHTSASAPAEEPTFTSGPGEVVQLHQGREWETLEEGRYAGWGIGGSWRYDVDVPDGWRVLAGTFFNAPTDGHGIFFIARVPKGRTHLPVHPCRDHSLWLVGPTVDDLARSIASQPVWRVSTPRPVTLDGVRAIYLEIELPVRVDPADCVDGSVSEWEAGHDGMATTTTFRSRWWILEVAGQRLLVQGRCYDTCTEGDLDTLSAMAESVTFARD
jgi:hypothetical protein